MRRVISLVLVVAVVLVSFAALASAADPGHSAPAISSGTFEAGNFVLDGNLTTTGNFSAGTFFIDTALGRVGIGTATPAYELDIVGIVNVSGEIFLNGTGISQWLYNQSGVSTATINLFDQNLNTTNAVTFDNLTINDEIYVSGNGSLNNTLFLDGDGQVGIGISSPSEPLHVIGNSRVETGHFWIDNGYNIYLDGGSDTYLTQAGSDIIGFVTGGSERVRIDSSGNVGIGTSTPQTLLHLEDSSTVVLTLNNTGASGREWELQSSTLGEFEIVDRDQAAARLLIDNSGNIGIGTATPSNRLDVRGSGNFSGDIFVNNGTGVAQWLYNQTGDFNYNQTASPFYYNQTYIGDFNYNQTTTLKTSNIFDQDLNSTSNVTLQNMTLNGDLAIQDGLFANGSSVGIGTATPSEVLDINGSIHVLNDGTLRFDSTSPSTEHISFADTVGINYKGSSARSIQFQRGGAALFSFRHNWGQTIESGAYLGWGDADNDSPDASFSRLSAGVIAVGTGANGEIDGTLIAGDIGIGTITPTAKLDVNGTVNITGELTINGTEVSQWLYNQSDGTGSGSFENVDGVNVINNETAAALNVTNITIGDGGRIGIGTVSPVTLLHINQPSASLASDIIVTNGDSGSTAGDGLRIGYHQSNYAFITNQEATDLRLGVDGTDLITLDRTGGLYEVGIGTDNPSNKLDVRGDGNFSGDLYVANGTLVNQWLYNQTYIGDFNYNQTITQVITNIFDQDLNKSSDVTFDNVTLNGVLAVQDILFANGSSVGIGNSNPITELDIHGDLSIDDIRIRAVGNRLELVDPTQSEFRNLRLENLTVEGTADSIRYQFGGSNFILREASSQAQFVNSGQTDWINFKAKDIESSSGNIYSPSSTDLSLGAGGSGNTVLTIDTSQNVGIGITSPSNRLDVRGDGNFSGDIFLNNATGIAQWLYNQTYIGDFNYNFTSVDLFNYNQTGLGGSGLFGNTDGANVINNETALALNLTGNITIGAGGRIGVGTETPTYSIQSTGDIAASNILLTSDGNGAVIKPWAGVGNIAIQDFAGRWALYKGNNGILHLGGHTVANGDNLVVATDGKVGVGTTNPTQNLTVDGSFNATSAGGQIVLEDDGDVMIGI